MTPSPDNSGSSSFGQGEADRLPGNAPAPALLRADGKRGSEADPARVSACDFRTPLFLVKSELRRLRNLHEDFIRYLSARLALLLRMECGLKLTELTTLSYGKFTESLPGPTHICLFKAEPLVGVGVLELNSRLALTLVDRMLGGRGQPAKTERALTEIETALLEDVLKAILEEWGAQWKGGPELQPVIIGHESNGRFLQTSPRDAAVLVLTVEFTVGDCIAPMQIGVPFYTIEPLVKALESRRHKEADPAAMTATPAWRPVHGQINLPLRAEWRLGDLPLRELAALHIGDVLELPLGIIEQTTVLLNGSPKFSGIVGLENDRVAITLQRKLPAAEIADHF